MVAKISHGMSLYGALAYNYEKVAAGTAEILSGNRMISDRLGLPSEDIRLALLSLRITCWQTAIRRSPSCTFPSPRHRKTG